jgi:hypothetical protein
MKLTTTRDKTLTTISALVHGDSGVGKTTSLATLPEDKTLMVLTERGALPLRNKGFPVLRPKTWDDVISIPGMIANPDAIEDEAIKTAVKACRIVVVDSLSATAELCARHIIEVDRARLVQDRTGGKESTPQGHLFRTTRPGGLRPSSHEGKELLQFADLVADQRDYDLRQRVDSGPTYRDQPLRPAACRQNCYGNPGILRSGFVHGIDARRHPPMANVQRRDFHCQGRIGRLGKHRVAQLDGDICEDFEGSMIL